MDQVDELLVAECRSGAEAIGVIDAPDLVAHARSLTADVRVWCDDVRDADRVDPDLLVELPSELAGVDLALAHLPKSLAALDEQAVSVQQASDVTFLAGGRTKHMNRSMNEVLARHFTAVHATRGHRKSRALRAWGPVNRPSEWPKFRHHEDLDLIIAAHGATFSGTKIDAGTRLLLEHVAVEGQRVLDFGCGNGSITAFLARLGHEVSACDSSWSAVAATLATCQSNGLEATIDWEAGISHHGEESLDAIVTNPPFHRGTTKDSSDTLEMFTQAARVLRPSGELWCVFNSHLPYQRELSARVGQTTRLAQNRHYTLTRTIKRG